MQVQRFLGAQPPRLFRNALLEKAHETNPLIRTHWRPVIPSGCVAVGALALPCRVLKFPPVRVRLIEKHIVQHFQWMAAKAIACALELFFRWSETWSIGCCDPIRLRACGSRVQRFRSVLRHHPERETPRKIGE